MKKLINIYAAGFVILSVSLISCKKEIGSLNGTDVDDVPKNPSAALLNNIVVGTEAGMRNNLDFYLDVTGVIGREMYRFAGSEPRYTSELLGAGNSTLNNNTFYLTNPWNSRYRAVKNCNIMIEGANNSTLITATQKRGYLGFAKTIKAYELLLNLNLTYTNGIRIDVVKPDELGPFVSYVEGLVAIAALLDEGKADILAGEISFKLSGGFDGFSNQAGFVKFNRALAARVALYRQLWPAALAALNESFMDLNGNLNTGVFHNYSTGPNDQINPVFVGQNQNGEIRVAHPSYIADILPGDDRSGKATPRAQAASQSGLTSNRDVWVFRTSLDKIPIVRNEELILIYAEAKIQLNQLPDAIVALNRIRNSHNLPAYGGATTQAALITEMLFQRRYSLYFEGHRWIDLRRYNLLATLPIDRAGDDVWSAFPRPFTEGQQ